jgi:hypothetical protein
MRRTRKGDSHNGQDHVPDPFKILVSWCPGELVDGRKGTAAVPCGLPGFTLSHLATDARLGQDWGACI